MRFPPALILLPVLITAPGCASYSARALDTRQAASSIVEQKEAEGLYVAVKNLSQPRESLRYFDRDLRAYGIVPVLLLLELDRESQGVFDVRREDIFLCLRDGTRLETMDPGDVAEEVQFSHIRSVFGFFLIFPGFFVASSVSGANEEIEADYQQKSVKSIRINPNMRSFHSAIFFRVPAEQESTFTMEDAFVEAKVYKQGQGSSPGKCLEFPVHFGR